MRARLIEKRLTDNDTGASGTHQSGILVPKDNKVLSFFPVLPLSVKNPRQEMMFIDNDGRKWSFNFIHYNNKVTDNGTRDEYRLTGMTGYFRATGAKSGDTLVLERCTDSELRIRLKRLELRDLAEESSEGDVVRLTVTKVWRSIIV